MRKIKKDKNLIDARVTTQEQAVEILENLLYEGFFSDIEELSVILDREPEELEDMLDGEEIIDDDLTMKMRGLAQQREIEIE